MRFIGSVQILFLIGIFAGSANSAFAGTQLIECTETLDANQIAAGRIPVTYDLKFKVDRELKKSIQDLNAGVGRVRISKKMAELELVVKDQGPSTPGYQWTSFSYSEPDRNQTAVLNFSMHYTSRNKPIVFTGMQIYAFAKGNTSLPVQPILHLIKSPSEIFERNFLDVDGTVERSWSYVQLIVRFEVSCSGRFIK